MIIECKTHDEWLLERRKHIGASDASAVVGLSPWMSNIDLWMDKTSVLPPKQSCNASASIERGTKSESYIRELYAIEHPLHVVKDGTGKIIVSDKFPFMSCTLDGDCQDDYGKSYILEIKSVRASAEWKKDNVPQHYLIQCLHQLIVTGYEYAVLKARIIKLDGTVYENEYKIFSDNYIVEMKTLVEKEKEFWKCVETNTRPSKIINLA